MDQQFKEDARGNQIAIANIPEIELVKDDLVNKVVTEAFQIRDILAGFRNRTAGDVAAFVSLSAEKYDKKIGGEKGNVTLVSFDGKYQVRRCIDESISFDEKLQIAQEIILELMNEWSEGARSELVSMVNLAFKPNAAGKLDTRRVLALKQIESEDPRWHKAMEAVTDSIHVVNKAVYFRIYERQNDGSYKQIPLDLANA